MQVHRHKYLQDYRRPFSSCKPNEEWPYIALTCYNESEEELFYMKWLILDRLTINNGQVGVFVKCPGVVPAYKIFYKNKP